MHEKSKKKENEEKSVKKDEQDQIFDAMNLTLKDMEEI